MDHSSTNLQEKTSFIKWKKEKTVSRVDFTHKTNPFLLFSQVSALWGMQENVRLGSAKLRKKIEGTENFFGK